MKQRHTTHIAVVGVLVALVIAILAAIGWTIYWANQPNITTVSTPTYAAPTIPEQQPFVTPYFSTLIPADYKTQDNSNSSNPGSLQILAYGSGAQHTDIGFTSNVLSDDGIYGVAEYKMRRTEGSGYSLVPPDGFGGADYVFRKTGADPEMTAFITHNNRYLIVAITGATESLQAEQLQRIITSLEWNS